MSPTARQRLAALRAALRADGPKQHSDECLAARGHSSPRTPVPLTPGCPWCEQVRQQLNPTPEGSAE